MLFNRIKTQESIGFTLYGDYFDLYAAHQMIHDIVTNSPVLNCQTNLELGNFTLGLAYDIRKAYERQREIINLVSADNNQVTYYGVNVIFPYFILQLASLRWACTFTVVNRNQQSILYSLEWALENAMNEFDTKVSLAIFERLLVFGNMLQGQNIDNIVNQIDACWIQNQKTPFIELLKLLNNVTNALK
jgi:hypothetical protein